MNKLAAQKFLGHMNDILNDRSGSHLASSLNTEFKGDEVDLLNQEAERQLNLRLNSRNVLFMKKVEKAKEKILEGTYGICEECNGEIGQKRLIARPTATLCITCKEEKEKIENNIIHHRRDLMASN